MHSPKEIAELYKVDINIINASNSQGLTEDQASKLLELNGPNVLTPPKKKHPFIKYLECLSTLFNVLLIFAGILMYIVFGIDREANQSNVSILFLFIFILFYITNVLVLILSINLLMNKYNYCYIVLSWCNFIGCCFSKCFH
jgi:magnesium-transporting ATPase (P-type)